MSTTKPKLARYSDYIITCHAKQRMFERYSISSTQEIQKLTKSAKEKGICIDNLTPETCSRFNISPEALSYFNMHYHRRSNNSRNYYYKDRIFVLGGGKGRTLISVVPCTERDIKERVTKKDIEGQNLRKLVR